MKLLESRNYSQEKQFTNSKLIPLPGWAWPLWRYVVVQLKAWFYVF